jgi:glycosyltransferase involved in cell wall biosynthesis
MRVLHLLNSLKHGGGENVALNYSIIFKTYFNASSIFVAKKLSKDYELLINNIVNVEERLSYKLLMNADYIFVHTNINLLKLFLYFIPIKLERKRVIYIQHLNYSKTKFNLLSLAINLICTDFIQITPITTKAVNEYIKIKKHFIVNFYINKYSPGEYVLVRRKTRLELGIPESKIVIMFSAIFKPGKGLDDFLKIADHFKGNDNFIFLIIGDGPEAYMIKEYKCDNIAFLGFQNDIEKFLISSDIYCFTSKFRGEMLPVALIESINTEKKILAYNTDINKFLLTGNLCDSLEDFIKNINENYYSSFYMKFDRNYAKMKLKELIN